MFDKEDSIGKLLGFVENKILEKNKIHYADKIPKINPFETINIHCNLVDGIIIKHDEYNHMETSIIASFKPNTSFGETIFYEPNYPLFFSINTDKLKNIVLEIRDENNELIDFDSSEITAILEMEQ